MENLAWLKANTAMRRVELLFFIYDGDTQALLKAEIEGLREYRRDFSYSAHLPDEVLPEHEELLLSIDGLVDSYVVHPPRDSATLPAFCALMDDWRERYGPERFFLENTRLSLFEAADAALASSRFGRPPLCADLGHLVMEGVDPSSWLESRIERVAEFHIHGYNGSSDHVPFSGDEAWFKKLDSVFRGFAGIVEIELFSWPDIEPALKALEPYQRSS
ncbi:MAG TPA: hypothetical protein DCG47_08950 [Spirochaetaceae bacterium]|nr:hypothetical protein [Spirochaetaceae bacterium]